MIKGLLLFSFKMVFKNFACSSPTFLQTQFPNLPSLFPGLPNLSPFSHHCFLPFTIQPFPKTTTSPYSLIQIKPNRPSLPFIVFTQLIPCNFAKLFHHTRPQIQPMSQATPISLCLYSCRTTPPNS